MADRITRSDDRPVPQGRTVPEHEAAQTLPVQPTVAKPEPARQSIVKTPHSQIKALLDEVMVLSRDIPNSSELATFLLYVQNAANQLAIVENVEKSQEE